MCIADDAMRALGLGVTLSVLAMRSPRRRGARRLALLVGGLVLATAVGCSGYTLPATNVMQNSATLNASVSCGGTAGQNPPHGSPCVAWFKYWPKGHPEQAQTTTHTNPVTSAVSNFKLSSPVTGLAANTTYEFQVCGYGDENAPPPGSCAGVEPTPWINGQFRTGVAPDQAEDNRWSGYMIFGSPRERLPGGRHWTAGDNSNSVKLPDGRFAWVFADPSDVPLTGSGQSLCSDPRPESERGRSALVMDENGSLGPTLAGADGMSFGSLIPNANGNPATPWMPQGMTVETNSSGSQELRIFVIRTQPPFDPTAVGIARFSLAGQYPEFIELVNRGPAADADIFWGSGILDWVDGHTYIYGWSGGPQRPYLARSTVGNVLGAWEYWNGSGWTSNQNQAAPLADAAGQTIPAQSPATPIWRAGRFVMFSVNGNSQFSGQVDPDGAPRGMIQAWTSPMPWGPWTGPTNIYAPPEAQAHDALIYNVAVHPEISGTDPLLLSYNALWGCPTGATEGDRDRYRPHFIRVSAP
jgi:hypothetical protein